MGIRVAVLAGGRSNEREISQMSGNNVMNSLKRLGYDCILIDPVNMDFTRALREYEPDLVFIALHGEFGEDGTVQAILDFMGIPYTGSGVTASAMCMDKLITKKMLGSSGILTPKTLDSRDALMDPPFVIKPLRGGSSIGVKIVHKPMKAELEKGYFVEEYIRGMEVTVGIMEINGTLTALPVLRIMPRREFYDYIAKYTPGMTEFECPASLNKGVSDKIKDIALKAFETMGCKGFGRVDGIIDRNGGFYVLEINTIPGLTDLSDIPIAAKAMGMSFDDVIKEIVNSVLER